MIGSPLAWKCLVACLFFDESQQPTWPQIRHSRMCTQVSPSSRHSLQPVPLGVTSRIWSRWVQVATVYSLQVLKERGYCVCACGAHAASLDTLSGPFGTPHTYCE